MRESVPIARYSPVCNVLRQWKTSLILTYRVYRLYDIPHDSLKCNLKVLINEAFRVRGAGFLTVNRQGVAYWSVEPTSGVCFSFDKLLEMLKYLMDNIYIVVGNRGYFSNILAYLWGLIVHHC